MGAFLEKGTGCLSCRWFPGSSEDLQGAMAYCLIVDVSQMSTAAASAGSWRVSRNKRLIPPLCQLVVKDTGRGNPEESSMDALHAVHFYLDGRRNSRSRSPKSKMIGTEHPCIPQKS